MVRRANKKPKRQHTKAERKIILVASEGVKQTEKAYFSSFNSRQSEYRVVFSDGKNTDPIKVIKEAVTSANHKGIDLSLGDMVCAVFDTDFGKGKQIQEARRYAERHQVELFLSNPCFEVWLLLHFRFRSQGYHSSDEVFNELKNRWPSDKKNLNVFQSISDRTDIAVENAMRLDRFHDSLNSKPCIECRNPSTDVYQLVALLNRAQGGDAGHNE